MDRRSFGNPLALCSLFRTAALPNAVHDFDDWFLAGSGPGVGRFVAGAEPVGFTDIGRAGRSAKPGCDGLEEFRSNRHRSLIKKRCRPCAYAGMWAPVVDHETGRHGIGHLERVFETLPDAEVNKAGFVG